MNLKSVLILVWIFLLIPPVLSVAEQWTALGPEGGTVRDLAVNPHHPETVYVATWGGVFKSIDAGGSWNAMTTGLDCKNAICLAVHPQNPETVYVGTTEGVFKSINGGASWTLRITGLRGYFIRALAIAPWDPETIFASVSGRGVYRSNDGAAVWTEANTFIEDKTFGALAVDPVNANIVYAAGLNGAGVYKSTDSGGSWTARTVGLPSNLDFNCLAVDPQNSGILYLGASGAGVFKSVDSGFTWSASNNGLNQESVAALVIHPMHRFIIYAASPGGGVFRSENSGATWSPVNEGLVKTNVQALDINPQDPAILYAGTNGAGVFKTVGGAWQTVNNGLKASWIMALWVHPSIPGDIYAASLENGMYRSKDGGATWSLAGLDFTTVRSLAGIPQHQESLFAGTWGRGIFKTTNGGDSWIACNNGLTNLSVNALAIDPFDSNNMYAGTSSEIFSSHDGGASWSSVLNPGYPINTLVAGSRFPTEYYAGISGGGVYKSIGGGAGWTQINNGLGSLHVNTIAIDPVNPDIVFAGTGSGIYKSSNGGDSWDYISQFIGRNAWKILIDPSRSSLIYVGGDADIYMSGDGGESWSSISGEIYGSQFRALACDSASTTDLLAGSNGNGVFATMIVPPGLRLTAPNGGENLQVGTTLNITWTQTGISGNISVNLYKGEYIARHVGLYSASGGECQWVIPSDIEVGNDYRIKLSQGGYADESDQNFSINGGMTAGIEVTAPNGGESWRMGSYQTVSWSQTPPSDWVSIDLYQGDHWVRGLGGAPGAAGIFTWNVPDNLTPGTDYRIRVSRGASGDFSDAFFSISAAFFQFSQNASLSVPGRSRGVVAGDIRNDGVQRIVAGSFDNGTVHVFRYDCGQYVEEWNEFIANRGQIIPVAIGDIDNDGKNEFLVSNGYSDSLYIYCWNGSTYQRIIQQSFGSGYKCAVVCDLNRDGLNELIIDDGNIRVFSHQAGILRPVWTAPQDDAETLQISVGDPDNDQHIEALCFFHTLTDGRLMIIGYNNGQYTVEADLTNFPGGLGGGICADADGDGIQEIFTGKTNTGGESYPLYLVKYNGGGYDVQTLGALPWAFYQFHAGDLNGDGSPEISAMINGNGSAIIRREQGQYIIHSAPHRGACVFGDFADTDGDGRDEIIASSDDTIEIIGDTAHQAPWLKLYAPNGGESLLTGANCEIYWCAPQLSGDVKLELFRSGGRVLEIGYVAASAGSFNWTVPHSLESGGDYRIRVFQENTGAYSQREFSITRTNETVIKLLDSTGAPLAGGLVSYAGSSWQTLGSTDSRGQVSAGIPFGRYTFRMTYGGLSKDIVQDTSVNPLVVFRTVKTSVQLTDSAGGPLSGGAASYAGSSWRNIGSTDALGIVSVELLPGRYTFRMTWGGLSKDIAQDAGVNPLVLFRTVKVTVKLTDSAANPISGGAASYAGSSWRSIGSTDAQGTVFAELLPGRYTFRMTMGGLSKDIAQDAGVNPLIVFQTVKVTVKLLDSAANAISGGVVSYAGSSWRSIGSTDAQGAVSIELMPGRYTFRMNWGGLSKDIAQDAGVNPLIVFQTVKVTVKFTDSSANPISGGAVNYAGSSWRSIGSTDALGTVSAELLPGRYTFRLTWGGLSKDIAQDAGVNPLIVFQTVRTAVHLLNSAGNPVAGGVVSYAGSSWRPFGVTAADGPAYGELLPGRYTFRLTLNGVSTDKTQDTGADPVVIFHTAN